MSASPRAICFVGWSGAGKTALLERLLPVLARGGRRVGYLKTDAHGFEMDRRGKDTARLFDAGSPVVGILGPGEAAVRLRPPGGTTIEGLLARAYADCDLVLVEGGKRSTLPKIEVLSGEPVLPGAPPDLLALVGDRDDPRPVARFARDDVEGVAALVLSARLP